MALAKKHKVAILAGSICERIPGEKKVYNTSVLINEFGEVAAKYRKTHLFNAVIGKTKVNESQHFLAGRKMVLVNIGIWTAGLSICYDLRFPEFYRKYTKAGADILCVPSAFTKVTGQAHWEILLRGRAIENLCYVLAPNQIGTDGRGIIHYGNSMIIDPWGRILARASHDKEEIIFADLQRNQLTEYRKVLPMER
jgi:predicted amidohydrolase